MENRYILVDYENVPVKSLALLQGHGWRVKVFLGKANTKLSTDLAVAMQSLGERGEYVRLHATGPNALDFHIAYFLGQLLAAEPKAHCFVISKDKGFDALIARLAGEGKHIARHASIDEIAEFKAAKPRPAKAPVAATAIPTAVPRTATRRRTPAKPVASAHDANLDRVLENLAARARSRPATLKTLLGTIQNQVGKDQPPAEAQRICNALVARGIVEVTGSKVRYHLPAVSP